VHNLALITKVPERSSLKSDVNTARIADNNNKVRRFSLYFFTGLQ
jgi:hypothetical protein